MAKLVLPLLVVVVLFVSVLPNFIDPASLGEAFRQLSWWEWLALVAVSAARFPIFGWLHTTVLPGLRLWPATHAYLASTATQNTLPGPTGMATRYGLYRSWGFHGQDAALSISLGGLAQSLVTLLLPVPAIIVFAASGSIDDTSLILAIVGVVLAAAGIAAGTFALRDERVADAVGSYADGVASRVGRWIKRPLHPELARRLVEIRRGARRLVGARGGEVMLAALSIRLSELLVFFLALRFVGLSPSDLSFAAIFVVFALVSIFLVIQITPGGAGVAEVLFIAALTAATNGQFEAQIAAAVFLYRGGTWLLPIVVGAPFVLRWMRSSRRGQAVPAA